MKLEPINPDLFEATDAERQEAPAEEEVLPYLGDASVDHTPQVKEDTRPASVRTAELFERMKTRRKVLLAILDFCREPALVEDVNARADELQANYRSVFDGPAMCNLLERAGAIEKVTGGDAEQAPEVVVVNGVECMRPAERVVVRYQTTPAGMEQLEADKPLERLQAVFERDGIYKPIYLRILKACTEEGGKSAKQLGELVDSDPLLQEPRFWAAHFFNILGECDALSWAHTWSTTELGYKAIEALELEGVQD